MILELLTAAIIMFIAICLGHFVFRKSTLKADFWEEIFYSGAIGIGLTAYFVFFLGIMGLLKSGIFIVLGIGLLLFSIREVRIILKRFEKLEFNWIFVITAMFLVLVLLGSLSPPTGWDTQRYHLPMAEEYVEAGKIGYIPIMHSDLPALGDMLIVLGMLLKNDILAGAIFYLTFLLVMLGVFVFTRKLSDFKTANLAALIFVISPLIFYYAGTVHTDMILALFTVASVFSFYEFLESREKKWLIISAVFLGLSISVKITAMIQIAAFLLIFFARFIKEKGKAKQAREFVLFFLVGLAIFSPWLIKNLVLTGNPVYPMAYDYFGGPQDTRYIVEYTARQLDSANISWGLWGFIISPLFVTISGYEYLSSFSIVPVFLIFLPLLLFFRKSKLTNFLILFSIFYYAAWFFIHPYLVKIIPLLPFLSILAAYSIRKSIEKKIVFRGAILLVIFSVVFSLASAAFIYKDSLKVSFGLEAREDYLSKNLEFFNTFNFANDNLKSNDKILLIGDERSYYLDTEFQDGDPVRQGLIDYRNITEAEFGAWLKEGNITHLIVNRNYFVNISDAINLYGWTKSSAELVERFISKNCGEVFENNGVYLYEVKYPNISLE